MIDYMKGNILKSKAKAIVNPVNCEGIMGKGLAYQIKQNYPNTFASYKQYCKEGRLSIGRVHAFYENGKYIISLPTKVRWREPSCLEYIDIGLDELKEAIVSLYIYDVAIPALGCGNGGLDWNDVKPLIEQKLEPLCDRLFHVYEPQD